MELNEAKEILNKNGFVLKERFVNVDEIRVPEWLWVAYETGDTSNLEDEEIVILHIFEKDHKKHHLEANDEPNFYRTNDVTDEGGMCYTVQVFEDRMNESNQILNKNDDYTLNMNQVVEMIDDLEKQHAIILYDMIEPNVAELYLTRSQCDAISVFEEFQKLAKLKKKWVVIKGLGDEDLRLLDSNGKKLIKGYIDKYLPVWKIRIYF